MSMDTHSKKFLDKIELLSKNHDTIDICRDFVLFAATSISNQSDLHWGHYSKDVWRKREDLYKADIISRQLRENTGGKGISYGDPFKICTEFF